MGNDNDTKYRRIVISCDEAINEIAEILAEADGEWIAEIYEKISSKPARYDGDSLIIVGGMK